MISRFDISKAFFDQMVIAAAATGTGADPAGLDIAKTGPNGVSYEPDVNGNGYVMQIMSETSVKSVGLSNSSSDDGIGFCQINVYTPRRMSDFEAQHRADQITSFFPKGQQLERNGQKITTSPADIGPKLEDAGFVWYPVTINYRVLN